MPKMSFEWKFLFVVTGTLMLAGAEARQQWEEEPGYREVNPDGEVIMVCRVRDKKGECRWERDNTPIAAYPGKYEWAGDAEAGDCSLRILAAKYEYDNGAWVCQVTASSFRERDTLISHPANLVVRAPPSSVHLRLPGDSSPFIGSLVATSGAGVEVECAVSGGNPPPGVQWYLGGQRWEEGDRVIEELDQTTGLTVSSVTLPVSRLDNGKEVRCEVIHEALTTIMEVSTALDIQYPPQVSVEMMAGDLSDISEGDFVSLRCSARGNPAPEVLWYRDGSGEIVNREEVLSLAEIRRDQAGQYVCQANNSVGQSDPRKIDIRVKYGPVITSVGPSANVTQLLRSKLELTCQASGDPAPRYTWHHVTEAGASVRGHEKNLIITGLSYRDQGHYECRATNTVKGEERTVKSSLVYVNVTGAPRVAEKRSEVFIIQGNDATVSVEFCADPMPKLNWHLGGPSPGHSVLLCSECSHDKFSVLKETPGLREDCYVSSLRIEAADKTDTRDYQLHLENEHGVEIHTVRVSVGDLDHQTIIGAVVGGLFVLILLLIAVFFCSRRCCSSSKQLKQDIESRSSRTTGGGWSSESDVSITTDQTSEVSGGTVVGDGGLLQHYGGCRDDLSISQECIKPGGGLHSPTPSHLTDRPGSNASGPSRVSYNDLCFPKTANYGSMRKGGRCDVEARLAGITSVAALTQQNSLYGPQ